MLLPAELSVLTSPTAICEREPSQVAEDEPDFVKTALSLLKTPGFGPPLVAFMASIGVSNVVSAFIDDILRDSGLTSQANIDLAGAGFQVRVSLSTHFPYPSNGRAIPPPASRHTHLIAVAHSSCIVLGVRT